MLTIMDEIGLMGLVFFARRRRSAEKIRAFGITLPQFLLVQLARRRGAISPSAAAAELSCDRPTATLVAQKCVSRGWLIRRRSATDRRSSRLELSGEGEELLDRIEAAVHAGRTRLRPILMTSLAFVLGVLPLVIAEGAGAEMRQSLGTAVFFGMLGVTGFGLVFTPIFYVVVRKLVAGYHIRSAANHAEEEARGR